MDEEEFGMELEHYLEIGAITLEGMDENGELIFAFKVFKPSICTDALLLS